MYDIEGITKVWEDFINENFPKEPQCNGENACMFHYMLVDTITAYLRNNMAERVSHTDNGLRMMIGFVLVKVRFDEKSIYCINGLNSIDMTITPEMKPCQNTEIGHLIFDIFD